MNLVFIAKDFAGREKLIPPSVVRSVACDKSFVDCAHSLCSFMFHHGFAELWLVRYDLYEQFRTLIVRGRQICGGNRKAVRT